MKAWNAKDETGKIYDNLKVISNAGTRIMPSGRQLVYWNCECSCGQKTIVSGCQLRGKHTKSCGCLKKVSYHWLGYEEIGNTLWSRIKNKAKIRGIVFNITIEQAWDLFIKQDRKCALSGVYLTFSRDATRKKAEQIASLDRIDSNLGYEIENVQWVHKKVNLMKNNLKETDFIEWCGKIHNHKSV